MLSQNETLICDLFTKHIYSLTADVDLMECFVEIEYIFNELHKSNILKDGILKVFVKDYLNYVSIASLILFKKDKSFKTFEKYIINIINVIGYLMQNAHLEENYEFLANIKRFSALLSEEMAILSQDLQHKIIE